MPSDRLLEVVAAVQARRLATRRGPGRSIEELDSLVRLELVLAVEEAFGVDFADEELVGIKTLDALDAAIERKRQAAAPSRAVDKPPAAKAESAPPASSPVASPWHAPVRALAPAMMRLAFGVRTRGAGQLPGRGAFLLCANHGSHLDSLALLTAVGPRRADLVFPAARDYFFSGRRLARIAARGLPLVPLEREGRVGALKQNLRELEACAARGRIVVLFPEGTRSRGGELQPFRDGIAFLAERLRTPVVPCWIEGTARALPRGAWWPRPGRVSVAFGAPLAAPVAGDENFTERVRAAMLALRADGR
jgi:1-acyl-sn-glycerol-3-phosphate acyltransferase